MLAAGLEAEVGYVARALSLHAALPSMRCVGYRQVWEVQDGLVATRSELRDRGIYATRQLAKRQITWLGNTLQPQEAGRVAGAGVRRKDAGRQS
jgi:tRNA dimethylallyltransferase